MRWIEGRRTRERPYEVKCGIDQSINQYSGGVEANSAIVNTWQSGRSGWTVAISMLLYKFGVVRYNFVSVFTFLPSSVNIVFSVLIVCLIILLSNLTPGRAQDLNAVIDY
jgi:hypothetical protein